MKRNLAISVSADCYEQLAVSVPGEQSLRSFVDRLIDGALSLTDDELAAFVDRCRVGQRAAVARSAKAANRTYVSLSADLFDRIKLIAETFPTTKPTVLDDAITAALDAAEAEGRCQWYECNDRATHLASDVAAFYDDDFREIVNGPTCSIRLCGRHARGYDKQHAAVRKCQPITAATAAEAGAV